MGRSKKRSKGSKPSSSKKIPEPKVEIVEEEEEIAEVKVKSNKKRKKIFDKNAVKESKVKIENDPDETPEDEDKEKVDEEPDNLEEKSDQEEEPEEKEKTDDQESEDEEPDDDEKEEKEPDQEEDSEDEETEDEEEEEETDQDDKEDQDEDDEPEDEEETDDQVEEDQEPEEDDSEEDEEEQEETDAGEEEAEQEEDEESDEENEDQENVEDQESEDEEPEVEEEESEQGEDEESDEENKDQVDEEDQEEEDSDDDEEEEGEEEQEPDQEEEEDEEDEPEDEEETDDQVEEDQETEEDDSEEDEEEPDVEEEESEQEEDEESEEEDQEDVEDQDSEDEEPDDDEEEESDPDDGETEIEEYIDEKPAQGENVWNAVEWDDLLPPTDENVFTHGTIESVLKEVVETAWIDGIISDDEMALLNVLKNKLDIDDDTFNSILEKSRPEIHIEDDEEPEDEDTDDEEDEDYEEEEDDDLSEDMMDGINLDNLDIDEELEYLEGMVGPGPALPPGEEEEIPVERPKGPVKIEFEEDFQETPPKIQQTAPQPTGSSGMDYNPPPPPPPPPQAPSKNQGPGMITLTSSVRGNDAPLGRSFDLNKTPELKAQQKTIQKRCGSCNALIRLQPSGGKDRCPICGARIGGVTEVSSALRSILDQGKIAFKGGELSTAKELYGIALKQSPDNKEAKFFLMKLNRAGNGGPKAAAGSRSTSLDSRDISNMSSGVARLDQMIGGGMNVGSQMLIKGPPYSGKDILLDHLMASALRSGFPVIYVSSNRAMKDVMKGIVKQIPDFKQFNQSRRVRMYDLFSKHKGEQVLREGHRIFNIEVKADFKRFQADLVMVQESLVQEYGGGVLIINSLSPLITQVDQNDLMKFLQVLIARSKGYRFTNIMDLASGIHHETIVNSVEYLMDGTVELREKESRFSLRLRGFRQNILTKDWVDYNFSESAFNLVGSFNEERIV